MADDIDKEISEIKAEQNKKNVVATGAEIIAPELMPLISAAHAVDAAKAEKTIEKLEEKRHKREVRQMADIGEDRGGGPGFLRRGLDTVKKHHDFAREGVAKIREGTQDRALALFAWLALIGLFMGSVFAAYQVYLSGGVLMFIAVILTIIFFIVVLSGIETKQVAIVWFILLLIFGMSTVYQPRLESAWQGGTFQKMFGGIWAKISMWDPGESLKAYKEEQIAIGKGDYYAEQVDVHSKRELGAKMEELKTDIPEKGITVGEPFTVFTQIDIESIEPTIIRLNCQTDKGIPGDIRQDKEIPVERSASEYFDCDFNDLLPGTHTITLSANYDFSTLAYAKTYFIDRDSYRALISKDKDFFDTYDIADRDPQAISSEGPVGIGLGLGRSPIALGDDARALTLGITIHNRWDGHIKEMKGLWLVVPNGFAVETRGASVVTQVGCEALTGVTQQACDVGKEQVYQIETKLKEDIKTSKSYRVYLKPTSTSEILGTGPYGVHNFKVTANYVYELEKQTTVYIKEVEPIIGDLEE